MTTTAFIPNEQFMRLAIAKAKEGLSAGQTPFGACIVIGDEVVATSHNQVWLSTDITAHAEVVAIREACRRLQTIDLNGGVIYSTCEPCPMCFSACHWARLKRIVFGASVADAQSIGFNELTISNEHLKTEGHSGVEIVRGFLKEEALAIFSLWQSQTNRRAY